ncbi:MAG: ADP-ribosylglycohydrolase family protein [Verrucomicrobia bacterium]|nr:ADP-ribosylglycohydrolase family protein [Verrucomicrobiota bacterium]
MTEVDALQNTTVEDRLRGAVWGQFIGDAAALGTHWIYDLDERQQLYPDGISGFEAPKEGHYHVGKKPGTKPIIAMARWYCSNRWQKRGGSTRKALDAALRKLFDRMFIAGMSITLPAAPWKIFRFLRCLIPRKRSISNKALTTIN